MAAAESPDSGGGSSRARQRAVVLAGFVMFSLVPLVSSVVLQLGISATLTALLLVAIAARWRPVWPYLLLFALIGWLYRPALLMAWPLPLVLALIIFLAICGARNVPWLKAGRLDRRLASVILEVIAVSGGALLLWFLATRSDLAEFQRRIPAVAVWLLPVLGLAFSAVNAAAEEMVFRGAVTAAVNTVLGSAPVAVCMQAASFGLYHYRGVPSGAWGVALTAVYGAMLGVLRQHAGGMLAPWLAHVVADLLIFTILWTLGT